MNDNTPYFDNAKFFLMVLIIVSNAMQSFDGLFIGALYKFLYLFHIPCLIFIFGYSCRSDKGREIWPICAAYLVFQTLYSVFNVKVLGSSSPMFMYFVPYWIMWLVMAMIAWKLMLPHLERLKHPLIISVFMVPILGCDLSAGIPLAVSRIIVFLPFFLAGYYMEDRYISRIQSIKIYFSLATLMAVYIAVCAVYPENALVHGVLSYGGMGMSNQHGVMARIGVMLAGAVAALAFLSIMPKSRTFYTGMGGRALQAYLLHGFILKLLDKYQVYGYMNSDVRKALFFLGTFVLAVVLMAFPGELLLGKINGKVRRMFLKEETA